MVTRQTLSRLALTCTALAFVVVVLGAYVRLSGAGLGCPDWPGCYGKLLAPAESQRSAVAMDYERPLEVAKAWKEMIHRYVAAALGLGVVLLAATSWRRRFIPGQRSAVALAVVLVVGVQALLGMWTVTLLLKPLVVVLHLIGGFTTLSLLWWVTLRNADLWSSPSDGFRTGHLRRFRLWAVLALALLGLQVALGGWTSSNYAALACPDVPVCHGEWWPDADFAEGFVLWRGIGPDYEGGVLAGNARVAIHIAHRLGALVTFLYIGWFTLWLVSKGAIVGTALVVLALLLAQVSFGVGNVVLGLPLPVAVLHNGGAAILLLGLVTVLHRLWPARTPNVGC